MVRVVGVTRPDSSGCRQIILQWRWSSGMGGWFRRHGNLCRRFGCTSGSGCRKLSMSMKARSGLLSESRICADYTDDADFVSA